MCCILNNLMYKLSFNTLEWILDHTKKMQAFIVTLDDETVTGLLMFEIMWIQWNSCQFT